MKISTLNKILTFVALVSITASITASLLVLANRVNVYKKTEFVKVELPVDVWYVSGDKEIKIILPNGKSISSKQLTVEEADYDHRRNHLYY